MTDPICVGFLLTVYVLPLVALFGAMAVVANIIELYMDRRNRP